MNFFQISGSVDDEPALISSCSDSTKDLSETTPKLTTGISNSEGKKVFNFFFNSPKSQKKAIDLSFLNEPGPLKKSKSTKSPTLKFLSKLTSPNPRKKKPTKEKEIKNPPKITKKHVDNAMDDVVSVTETLYTEGHSPHDSEDERSDVDFDNVDTEVGSIGESFYDHPDIVKYLDEMLSGSKSPNNIVLGKLPSPDLEEYRQGQPHDNILNYSPTVPNVNSPVQKNTEKPEETNKHEDKSIIIEI
jgi:hypothetical protein